MMHHDPIRVLVLEGKPYWDFKFLMRELAEDSGVSVTGAVRINLVGREEHGLVNPGQDFETLCEQLTRDLKEIRNDETGELLVTEVRRTRDLYSGDQFDLLPDLLVTWNRSKPINVVFSPKIGKIRHPHPTVRTGDHRPGGMVFAQGPGLAPSRLNDAVREIDLAPTIAAILGVPTAQFQGRPVEALGSPVTAPSGSGAPAAQ